MTPQLYWEVVIEFPMPVRVGMVLEKVVWLYAVE